MQFTISQKQENPLLGRVEVSGSVEFESVTPSNTDVAAHVAKECSGKQELCVVKHVYTQFSSHTAEFSAVLYKSQEAKNKFERMNKHLRKKEEERKKAEAKAKEEAAKKAAEEKAAAEAKAQEETQSESQEESKEE